jgi:hypothetical protein
MLQSQKVGVSGSFINQVFGNNNSEPKVGEYCTFLHYTDRSVGIVREYDPKTMIAVVESCHTAADLSIKGLDTGHQHWVHTPSGHTTRYQYRKNGWYALGTEVNFTKEFAATIPTACIGIWLRKNNPELLEQIYGGHIMPCNVVEGITKAKNTYSKTSILFGAADYYYDWSF